MVAGVPPIRARKARYYEDARFAERILAPSAQIKPARVPVTDDWSALAIDTVRDQVPGDMSAANSTETEDAADSERRRQPELGGRIADSRQDIADEFDPDTGADDEEAAMLSRQLSHTMQRIARQADLDPADGML